MLHRLEERGGHAGGRRHAEGVAEASGVLDRDQPVLSRDPDAERSALASSCSAAASTSSPRSASSPRVRSPERRSRSCRPSGAGPRSRGQVALHRDQRVGIEEVAQLVRAEQLAQQVAVEGQRLHAALRRGRVILVHRARDEVEGERLCERRGLRGLDRDQRDLARLQPRQQFAQRGQVEVVLQELAVGLEHDRERSVALGDLQERLGPQPLLPERGSLARAPARDQERARGVLAEARAVQRGAAELADDDVLDGLGVERDEPRIGRDVRVGKVHDDAVVRPERLRVEAGGAAELGAERERPGRVDAAAEGRQDAQAPVADLVAEALDDDRPVGGDDAGRALLVAHEATRFEAARGSHAHCSTSCRSAASSGSSASSRHSCPTAPPSSAGRPT